MKSILNISILLSIVFISCEEQMVPIPEFTVPETNKVVLIEELTGVSCPNCPRGVAAIEAILTKFEGLVVTYGVHGELQSEPKSNSKYDFRNEDAFELEIFLLPFWGKPSAAINRVFFEGEDNATTTSVDLWSSFVEDELTKPQQLDIAVNSDYNEGTRTATINIGVTTLAAISESIQLNVAITESNLIDPQDDVNTTIEDFVHKHVLKDMLTQILGDEIGRDVSANESLTKSYSYTVPAELNGEWLVENMEIIAFVTSTNHDGEVLQAGSIHLD